MGPMSSEVDPGYQTKSMVFKRGTKGSVVVAVVVSDVNDWRAGGVSILLKLQRNHKPHLLHPNRP